MALPWCNNWACKVINDQITKGTSAKDVAIALATQPRVLEIIQKAIDSAPKTPHGPGYGGSSPGEEVARDLSAALTEMPS